MNKKIYSFGMAAMMLLFSGNVMATDYYLSVTGDDANDGKTAATAWATLAKLGSGTFQVGDRIFVSGIIKVDEMLEKPRLKEITFVGTNPETDGFDAEGKCPILHTNLSLITFKNLSFKNGHKTVSTAREGAAAIYGTHSRFTLENCVFEGNLCEEVNANACAGAISVNGANPEGYTGQGGIFATNCRFVNNTSSAGGGAILGVNNTIELKNCYFLENKATSSGGAVYGNSTIAMNIDGCAFEGNETTTKDGGAIYLFMNELKGNVYTISNSTFYKNQAKVNGGAFAAGDSKALSSNTINFVHCTASGNHSLGGVNNAGGINVENKPGVVNIVNTIIQGNTTTGNANLFADVTFGTTNVNFKSSYVGAVRKLDDNASYYTFDASSKLNNLPNSNQIDQLDLGEYKADAHIIPLKDSSDPTLAANLDADAEYGVTNDQLGNKWEKTYIGAVQLTETEFTTGISGIKTDAPKSLKGIYNIAGQYVGNDASKLTKGLYIIGGKKVVIK